MALNKQGGQLTHLTSGTCFDSHIDLVLAQFVIRLY